MVVAYKDNVSEITDLTEKERALFMDDVAHAANAVRKVFNPDKINYGSYYDAGYHLHFHIVPKYRDEFEWGDVFAMNPGKTLFSKEKYEKMMDKIKAAL